MCEKKRKKKGGRKNKQTNKFFNSRQKFPATLNKEELCYRGVGRNTEVLVISRLLRTVLDIEQLVERHGKL